MASRLFVRFGVCAIAAFATAVSAATLSEFVNVATFNAGRFVTPGGEVYAGLFGSHVKVDTLTVGEATFRARFDEFIEAATVRISVAPARDAEPIFQLLSDEQIASGRHGVAYGLGRDVDRARYSTVLDVMQGMDLARMLYTDGTMHVRVDLLLTTALRDSHAGEHDLSPEALLLGSFSDQNIRLGAIIAGNVDQPVLAAEPVHIDPGSYDEGFTGVAILLGAVAEPQPISIVGLDLYDLGVGRDSLAIGYRLEIEPGRPASFNLVGAGRDWQRDLASPIAMLEEPEAFDAIDLAVLDGWEPRGGGSGGRPFMSQPFVNNNSPGGGGGFTGGGGGSGGGIPPAFRSPPEDPGDPGDPGNGGGNGPGDGGGNDNNGPIVPAPGTLLIVLASALGCRRRRRRA